MFNRWHCFFSPTGKIRVYYMCISSLFLPFELNLSHPLLPSSPSKKKTFKISFQLYPYVSFPIRSLSFLPFPWHLPDCPHISSVYLKNNINLDLASITGYHFVSPVFFSLWCGFCSHYFIEFTQAMTADGFLKCPVHCALFLPCLF